ncbi:MULTISPECIES: hypothetical protein [unclassified Streptomyces]|uniref:hypothetical protein n=1 Tax=unclassified Streptomyces TaxID=2593676 RepID=UPI00037C9AE6|nr:MULTISPECIES: hypothetical protein [unclassified Streptomyces]
MSMNATSGGLVDAILWWGALAAATAAICTVVWKVVRWAVLLGRKVNFFIDDFYGEAARPGVPARPGLLERVSGVEETLAGVVHELHPNDGGSLRDAVDQANRRLRQMCPDCDQEEGGEQ